MARIRSVHPEQWSDEQFVSCTPLARLLAIGIRNEADDNGIFEWNLFRLKVRILPADNCEITDLLADLLASNQIIQYEIEGKAYGLIRNFNRFQRPKKPSYKYPLPVSSMDLPQGYSFHISGPSRSAISPALPQDFGTTSPALLQDFGKIVAEVVGEGEGEGENTCAAQPHDVEPEGFANSWNAYPKREGGNSRKEALKQYRARVKQGATPADLLAGVERYAAFILAKGQEGTVFVKQASTFFGTGEHWREAWAIETAVKSQAWAEGFL